MTNETEMPERIWAWTNDPRIKNLGKWATKETADVFSVGQTTQYTRADLADAKDKRIEELKKDLTLSVSFSKDAHVYIEELEAKLASWQSAQHYSYIGIDGKQVRAVDLENRAIEAEAKLAKFEYDPKCAKCGHPKSNHPYRHPFQTLAELQNTTATRG